LIQIYFLSERISKLDINIKITAISLYYLRLVGSEHRTVWLSSYESSYIWLKQQIKNEEFERELIARAKKFVIDNYKIDDETIESDSKIQNQVRKMFSKFYYLLEIKCIQFFFF